MTEKNAIRMLSMSLCGRKHKEKDKPCEDASMTLRRNGVSIICLADGAGSSQYSDSDVGSQCVVDTVCNLLSKHFDAFFYDNHEALVRSVLVAAIQSELTIRAKELNLKNSDTMASTMLFCAVKDSRVIFGHIGDGIIVRVTGSGMQPVTIPQNGEDISSTIFVTLPHAQNYLRLIRTTTDDTHAIVLMTDGISDMVYDNTKILLMPVIARLAEFGSLPYDEGYEELEKTIQSFIIESSPLSDDASIGILYFEGTNKPDPSLLGEDKSIIPRESCDNISAVQHDILPTVQRAREIIAAEKVNDKFLHFTETPIALEQNPDRTEDVKTEPDTAKPETPVQRKPGLWKRIYLAVTNKG